MKWQGKHSHVAVHASRRVPSLSNQSYFLPSTPFPRVTMDTSLQSLEHTRPYICKALGSLPRGNKKESLPICGLACLIYSCLHLCLCCFVCFLLGLMLFILEAPGSTPQTWLRLHWVLGRGLCSLFLLLGMDQNLGGGIPLFACQRVGRKHILFMLGVGEETNDYAKWEEWCHKGISKNTRQTCCHAHPLFITPCVDYSESDYHSQGAG